MDYAGNVRTEGEFGWDDSIQNDSLFTLVSPGDYNFKVVKFERGRYEGGEKIGPCPVAYITVEVNNGFEKTQIIENLYLHSKCEGIMCAFFTAIGQRKHGEVLKPRWNEIIGATGTCRVKVDTWEGRSGKMQSNKVQTWYEKGHTISAPDYSQPVYNAPPQKSFTPGSF